MDNPMGTGWDNTEEKAMEAVDEPLNNPEINRDDYALTSQEADIIGEVGNICMGTSATTLSTLLQKKVSITTPKVNVAYSIEDLGHYKKPFLAVEVSYTEGVDGYNILLMQEDDVKVITDLLMGGPGVADPDNELGELHFSAISEVMNQMVGSASTSLSNMISQTVNITPPRVKRIMMEDEDLSTLVCRNDIIIKTSFAMEIEGILNSELMQLLPYTFGKQLAKDMMFRNTVEEEELRPRTPVEPPAAPLAAAPAPAAPPVQAPVVSPPAVEHAAAATPRQAASPLRQAQMVNEQLQQPRVGVKSMQFTSFDDTQLQAIAGGENIGLILDVPLQITVELGKCKRSIKDILGFNMGSVIVLDRLAGEMVDIMVNGKLFARGEVVVIDDNYGVRVTDIIAMPQI